MDYKASGSSSEFGRLSMDDKSQRYDRTAAPHSVYAQEGSGHPHTAETAKGIVPRPIQEFIQPLGGLFSQAVHLRREADEPQISIAVVQAGNVGQVCPHLSSRLANFPPIVSGAGTGLRNEDCQIPAMVEALERYCACVYTEDQFIWATAKELGHQALDLEIIPRCSTLELSHPRCPLVTPDKEAPIRWVQALSLFDGQRIYVPAVMAYLCSGFLVHAERICVPISTGCAGHISYAQALLAAILEVIERDAISIVWLQKLGLPKIHIDILPEPLAAYWERYESCSKAAPITFFDATTDLGIPTVYGIQVAPLNRQIISVACSTSLNPAEAVAKIIRDVAAVRAGLRRKRAVPDNLDDFVEVSHGATYMSSPEHATAFDFLLQTERQGFLSKMPSLKNEDVMASLSAILGILKRKGLETYAVDLTTDEAVRCGVRVVRVLIPGLQPLGYYYRARYLGHRRLYQAPKEMGYATCSEMELNHWPQPFA